MNPNKPGVNAPLWLLAELTYRCPLQCPYCSNPLDFAREGRRRAEHRTMDRGVPPGPRDGRRRSWASPAVNRCCARTSPELIHAARGLGFYTNLITSGIGLDEKRLTRFADAGLDHIQISFQAADEEVNNLLAGSRKAFAQKLAMARAVKTPTATRWC